jgi:hypothetical protein
VAERDAGRTRRVRVVSGVASAVVSGVVRDPGRQRPIPLCGRAPRIGEIQKTIPVPSRRSP